MSIPKPKLNKKIPHIDARSLEEISLEIGRLKDQLKYNTMCLNLKRKELTENKLKSSFQKIIEKPRKTFSYRINADQITPDIQTMVQETLQEYLKKLKSVMKKAFFINNFIYFKTNINITIKEDTINLPNGMVMTQINPKDILKCQ